MTIKNPHAHRTRAVGEAMQPWCCTTCNTAVRRGHNDLCKCLLAVTGVIDRSHGALEVRFPHDVAVLLHPAHGRTRVFAKVPFSTTDPTQNIYGARGRAYQRAALRYFLQGQSGAIRCDHDGDLCVDYYPVDLRPRETICAVCRRPMSECTIVEECESIARTIPPTC